jgi:hypothetical protein
MTVHRPRRHKPLCDIHPVTGACIEMFYADRNAGIVRQGAARVGFGGFVGAVSHPMVRRTDDS